VRFRRGSLPREARFPQRVAEISVVACFRTNGLERNDFYARVNVGTKVIMQPMDRRADNTDSKPSSLAPPEDEISRHKNGAGSAQSFCFLR
jgi:hypothetical protein